MMGEEITYKRTEGVDSSHGSDYERELQSLVYLRCLNMHREWTKTGNSGLKSFYLANNVKHIGVFDDVVLRVESVVDGQVKPKLIFVQCKHVLDPIKSKTRFLKYINDKKQIKNWFDAFLRIRRILVEDSVSEDLLDKIKTKELETELHKKQIEDIIQLRKMFDCKDLDFEFIFYTNMIPEDENFSQLFERNPEFYITHKLLIEIFNTANMSQFEGHFKENVIKNIIDESLGENQIEKLLNEFCSKFRVFFNQSDDLSSKIKFAMKKGITRICDIESLYFYLMEEQKLFFCMSSYCQLLTENTELLKNVQYFCYLKRWAINRVKNFRLKMDNCSLFSDVEMGKLKELLKSNEVNIISGNKKLELIKLTQFVFAENVEYLLIFLNNKRNTALWECARQIKIYQARRIFIVAESLPNVSSLYENETLIRIKENDAQINYDDQLSASGQDLVLNSHVCFQGVTVKLMDICSKECVFENCVIFLLEKKILNIGKQLPKVDTHLPINFQIKIFNDELLSKIRELYMQFDKDLKYIVVTENNNEISIVGEPLENFETAKNVISNLRCKSENSFYLCYMDGMEMQLICCFGETSNNTQWKIVNEEDLFKIDFHLKILYGEATDEISVGPSTLLTLAQKYKENHPCHWVFFIDLLEHLVLLRKYIEVNEPSVQDFVAIDLLGLKGIEYKLFVNAYKETGHIALFLNAADEMLLAENNISLLLSIFQAKFSQIFVLIIPSCMDTLEKVLLKESIIYREVKVEGASKNLIGNQEDSHPGHQLENITDSNDELTKRPSPIHSDSDDDGTISSTGSDFDTNDHLHNLKNKSSKIIKLPRERKSSQTFIDFSCTENNTEEEIDLKSPKCEVDSTGNTDLHLASKSGNTKKMVLVMLRDPDHLLLNKQNKNGDTPLFIACVENKIQAIMFLLTHNDCKLEICNKNGDSILHALTVNANLKIMKMIVERERSLLNMRNLSGVTPLHLACSKSNVEAVKFLIDNGCLVNARDRKNNTVLHYASKHGNIEIMQLLIQSDCSLLNMKNKKHKTPLLLACGRNNVDAVEFLLYDGYVGARDNSDLRYDSRQSGTERCDKNMQICDREGNTVLHYASRNGNKEIMHLLLQRDITLINRQNMHGETPLHIAIEENNFDASHYLLSFKECLVNLQNITGDTVLHYAVKFDNFYEIDIEESENSKQITTSPQFEYTEKTCIPGPSSVDIKCKDRYNNLEIIKLLLNQDKSLIDIKNKNHQTPIELARTNNKSEIVINLLLSKSLEQSGVDDSVIFPSVSSN